MFIVYYGMIGKTNIPKQIVNMLFVILTGHDNLDDKTIRDINNIINKVNKLDKVLNALNTTFN